MFITIRNCFIIALIIITVINVETFGIIALFANTAFKSFFAPHIFADEFKSSAIYYLVEIANFHFCFHNSIFFVRQPGRSVLSLLTLQIYNSFLYLQNFFYFFLKIELSMSAVAVFLRKPFISGFHMDKFKRKSDSRFFPNRRKR